LPQSDFEGIVAKHSPTPPAEARPLAQDSRQAYSQRRGRAEWFRERRGRYAG
jgi:hypothetical protein